MTNKSKTVGATPAQVAVGASLTQYGGKNAGGKAKPNYQYNSLPVDFVQGGVKMGGFKGKP